MLSRSRVSAISVSTTPTTVPQSAPLAMQNKTSRKSASQVGLARSRTRISVLCCFSLTTAAAFHGVGLGLDLLCFCSSFYIFYFMLRCGKRRWPMEGRCLRTNARRLQRPVIFLQHVVDIIQLLTWPVNGLLVRMRYCFVTVFLYNKNVSEI